MIKVGFVLASCAMSALTVVAFALTPLQALSVSICFGVAGGVLGRSALRGAL